ncbi:unnamed protein product [Merluccius merluccius]
MTFPYCLLSLWRRSRRPFGTQARPRPRERVSDEPPWLRLQRAAAVFAQLCELLWGPSHSAWWDSSGPPPPLAAPPCVAAAAA